MSFSISEVFGSKDSSRQASFNSANRNLFSLQNNNRSNSQRNQINQRITRSMILNFSQSQQQQYGQPVSKAELKNFQKNFLRNISTLTKKYILKNSYAKQIQKEWIRSNPYPPQKNIPQQQVLSEFYAWTKKLNVASAKKIRQNLGNQGKRYNSIEIYFQQFYKREAFRFYVQNVQIYIINHKFASNQFKKYRNQAEQNSQRKKYIKIAWKMIWIIKNAEKFKSLASIRY